MSQILFRVDGNSDIGLGHIYRTLALAEILKDRFDIEFVTKSNSTISPINDSRFNYIFIPEEISFDKEPYWI